MEYRMAHRYIRHMKETRQRWIEILTKNPDSEDAPNHIIRINSKISFLRTIAQYPADYEGDFE